MPRRHRHRKTMKGGFLDDFSNTLSGWGSSISQGASNLWDKTKNAASSATSSLSSSTTSYTPTTTTTTTTATQPMTTSTYGGKSRRRRMSGGFKDNTPTTGLAANAASFSGQTAQPHNWVGGKTRKHRGRKHRGRKHPGIKSRRHRR